MQIAALAFATTMTSTLQVLWLGDPPADLAASAWGPFEWHRCASLDEAARALGERRHDALVLAAGTEPSSLLEWQALSHAVLDSAVVVVAEAVSPDLAARLLQRGVQDLLPTGAADAPAIARVLRASVERKRLEMAARKAYATDLSTGLPNHAQLLEHMSHLLALREREPAPMALLVLRIEGLSTTQAALGAEAANVLRRKLAVRLRAGLRASDVVASIGGDAFAVLLAWIDAPADGLRVAAKLAQSLRQTVKVAGQERAVAVSVGVSQYPEQGRQAEELLHRAIGQAAATAAAGREGFANRAERGAARAANDEEPDPR
jgi:diguanylate cyclase (GGDEF)-like protein